MHIAIGFINVCMKLVNILNELINQTNNYCYYCCSDNFSNYKITFSKWKMSLDSVKKNENFTFKNMAHISPKGHVPVPLL